MTREKALLAAHDLMRFASHPIMGEEIEQALYDARWLINAANNTEFHASLGISAEAADERECLERFIASYKVVLELNSQMVAR
jgi:hypothetical protein